MKHYRATYVLPANKLVTISFCGDSRELAIDHARHLSRADDRLTGSEFLGVTKLETSVPGADFGKFVEVAG